MLRYYYLNLNIYKVEDYQIILNLPINNKNKTPKENKRKLKENIKGMNKTYD
jgi:hypothetical protein